MDGSAARAVLGVAPGTSRADIDIAFRRLAKATHPDRGGSAAAFRRLLEARQTALDAAPVVAPPRMPFIDAASLPDAPRWDVPRRPTAATRSFASHLRVAMRS
ncbi:MAG: J domain-containing protein [Actinomycetota bacterium]